jgi:hypothetical protein
VHFNCTCHFNANLFLFKVIIRWAGDWLLDVDDDDDDDEDEEEGDNAFRDPYTTSLGMPWGLIYR